MDAKDRATLEGEIRGLAQAITHVATSTDVRASRAARGMYTALALLALCVAINVRTANKLSDATDRIADLTAGLRETRDAAREAAVTTKAAADAAPRVEIVAAKPGGSAHAVILVPARTATPMAPAAPSIRVPLESSLPEPAP